MYDVFHFEKPKWSAKQLPHAKPTVKLVQVLIEVCTQIMVRQQ